MVCIVKKINKNWFHAVKGAQWKPLTDTWPEGTKFRLWNPQKDADLSENITWFGGMDVHLKGITAGIYGIDKVKSPERVLGPILNFKVSDLGYQDLFELFDYFPLTRILMETTGVYSFDPYYRCKDRYLPKNKEARVICMNAHDLSKLLVKNKKTDKVDTSRLAFLASVPELLRMSYIPTREEYTLRLILRQRNKYKNEASKNKNRCKTLLAAWGFRWRFDFGSKGQMQLMIRFIEQEENFGDFLRNLEYKPDIPKSLQRTLKTHKNKLLAWSSYAITDLERLILKILFGLKDKFEGLVNFYDKLIFEQLLTLPRFCKPMELIKNIPGMGEWSLATILLETGPISRFPTVGAYLSYAGVTRGIEESAEKNVRKGNNPHSHRILKQAYRTIGMAILGATIRAEKGITDDTFQQCHPLLEYAKKIEATQILNGKKANKIAAKAARIVYGILKSENPYDTRHEKVQSQEQQVWNEKNKLMVRYSAFQRQIALLKTTYEEIAEKSTLVEEPFIEDILTRCESIFEHLNREPHLKSLRNFSREIRMIKMQKPVVHSRKKKTSRKIHLKRLNQDSSKKNEEKGSEKD
jgi:transposase